MSSVNRTVLRRFAKTAFVATMAVLMSSSGEASAQPTKASHRDQARQLVYVGREKRESGQLAEALEAFKRAHALMNVPTTGLELAKTQVAAGKLVEARATLGDLLRAPAAPSDPPAFAKAKAEARTVLDGLAARIPSLTLDVPEDAKVTLDGEAVGAEKLASPIAVNPGAHEIVVRQGEAERRRTVNLDEGARETVRVTFPRAEAARVMMAPPEPVVTTTTNPLVYVGGAMLVAGAATGAITGGMTLAQRSSVEDRCAAGCPSDIDADVERGKMLGTTSTVAFAVAGAGAALMVYGLLFPSERRSSPTVGLRGAAFMF